VADPTAAEQFGQAVLNALLAGERVDIDGVGTFYPDATRLFRFEPRRMAKVFIAYVVEDWREAERLYDALEAAGFAPWIDRRKLLPGQNWPRAIENAIDTSDFFIACFSERSVAKKGGFQAEIRYALDCARQLPLDDIFVVPVRFGSCKVPRVIQKQFQYLDLLPDWDAGVERLLGTLTKEVERRRDCRR
jgi:hypothetical protein